MSYRIVADGPSGYTADVFTSLSPAQSKWNRIHADPGYDCGFFQDTKSGSLIGNKWSEKCKNEVIRKTLGAKPLTAWDRASTFLLGAAATQHGGSPNVVTKPASILPFVAVGGAVAVAAYFLLWRKK